MKKLLFITLLVLIIILGSPYLLSNKKRHIDNNINSSLNIDNFKEEVLPSSEISLGETAEVFEINPISEDIYNKIYGKSWTENAPISIESLSHITVTYWDFDNKSHLGELIVNASVGEDIKDIFKELYDAKYPIDKIKLIDEYDANDEASMKDNNTSAFCFRAQTSSSKLSLHSYGLAIDINPLQNPYTKGDIIQPGNAIEYVDRSTYKKGMILKDDPCYKAFISRGWTWGGEWKGVKDYQHFEK